MSRRSKREFAPPMPLAPAAGVPILGAPMKPGVDSVASGEIAPPMPPAPAAGVPILGAPVKPAVVSVASGEATPPPPGWWTAPSLQNNLSPFPYGPWTGAVPTPHGHHSVDTSADLIECPPGGFLNFLQNGLTSFPTTQSAPMTQCAESRSKGKNVIHIDDGDNARTEKRLSWLPEEDERLVSAWLFHSNDPINGNCKKIDHYWSDVHQAYNSTTPAHRKRKVEHEYS